MVLLSVRERDELAEDIAEQIAAPGLWLLPVVALALGLAVRRGMKPLYELSHDVHSLDVRQARPLVDRWRHREFRATVVAINTLMERYQAALTRERALANEFAHEMRTPLAAVSLHARALKTAPEGPERDHLLARLDREVLRAGQVLTDLLALARASRAEWDEAAQELDLADLARRVVADFAPAAHESRHELALAGPEQFPMTGHPLLLELALRNLLENAVSHTPRGTHVEVQLDAQHGWIQVGDDAQPAGQAPPKDPGRPDPCPGPGSGPSRGREDRGHPRGPVRAGAAGRLQQLLSHLVRCGPASLAQASSQSRDSDWYCGLLAVLAHIHAAGISLSMG